MSLTSSQAEAVTTGPNMTVRLATSAVGVPIVVLLVWLGGAWFAASAAVLAVGSTLELSAMARRWGDRPLTPVAVIWSAALIVAAYLISREIDRGTVALPWVSVGAGVSLIWLWRRPPQGGKGSAWVATTAIVLYTAGLLFHAPMLRALDQGMQWVLFLLVVTFATDTSALVAGRVAGKRSLAPALSPAKTWEGAAGGAAGAVVIGLAAMYALRLDVAVWKAVSLGAVIGVSSQLGDLFESKLKRVAGVKDSGRAVPGHGGLLDRLDSIVFNLVVVYYFVS